MSNQQFERLLTNLQGIMRCPHCSSSYQMSDMHYLGQMDTMTFLHMRCSECQTPVFASVALTNEEGELKACDIETSQMEGFTGMQPELEFNRKQLDLDSQPLPSAQIPIEDLTTERLLAAAQLPVSYDQVLDAHEYLETFSGDFESVFGRA